MTTANDALNSARVYLGEGPDRFLAWYPAPAGTAWCAIFQSYVLTSVGIPTHFAWVSAGFDQYRSEGRTFAPHEAQPGDLVAFDYDGGGRSNYDHIAMVESVTDDGIIAINGNWQNRVQRVLHRWNSSGFAGGIAEIARPNYAPQPSPEDDDMRDCLIRDPRNGAVYRITQPGNVAVHLSPPAYEDAMAAVRAGLITDLGNASPATLGNFGILPSILEVKG